MYFVLGVLVAGILALAVAPAIWRRAARLTRARVEASLPMTLGEIRAEKYQLRAEFAVATRRLETTIGRLEERTTEQTIDIGRKRTEIERRRTFLTREFFPGERVGRYPLSYVSRLSHE